MSLMYFILKIYNFYPITICVNFLCLKVSYMSLRNVSSLFYCANKCVILIHVHKVLECLGVEHV